MAKHTPRARARSMCQFRCCWRRREATLTRLLLLLRYRRFPQGGRLSSARACVARARVYAHLERARVHVLKLEQVFARLVAAVARLHLLHDHARDVDADDPRAVAARAAAPPPPVSGARGARRRRATAARAEGRGRGSGRRGGWRGVVRAASGGAVAERETTRDPPTPRSRGERESARTDETVSSVFGAGERGRGDEESAKH